MSEDEGELSELEEEVRRALLFQRCRGYAQGWLAGRADPEPWKTEWASFVKGWAVGVLVTLVIVVHGILTQTYWWLYR